VSDPAYTLFYTNSFVVRVSFVEESYLVVWIGYDIYLSVCFCRAKPEQPQQQSRRYNKGADV
ncbi:hypothetical protein ACOZB2_28705, partial [Pantoea endophytica]